MAKKKKTGLWSNIQKKKKRIASGSGEKMRAKGDAGAPTEKSVKKAQAESKKKPRKKTKMTTQKKISPK